MNYKYRLLGWIALVLSVASLIVGTILRKDGYDYFGALVPALFGAGVVLAAMWFSAGRSEKTSRQFDTDRKDERTQLIRGKAAVTALFTVLILLLALGVWLGTSEHTAIALVVFGILFVGLIVFEIRITILEKKM